MKKRTMKLLTLIMAFGLVLSLTACGGSSDEAGTDEAETDEIGTDEAADDATTDGEPVTLTVAHFHTQDTRSESSESDTFWTMIEEFQAENPNVTLEIQELPQADFETKTQAQATAGELPDIFFMKGSWVTNFLANDAVYDLSDALDAYEYKDAFREGMFDAATRDGGVYGLPIQMTATQIVFYNAALWAEAGYDTFPTTWDEIYEANEKFKEMGIPTFALGNLEAWPAESCILSAYGDRYTGTDWTWSIINNDGEAKFTDQAFVDALAGLQDMKDLFNVDYNTLTNEQTQALYCNGEAAATIEGAWSVAYIQTNATEEVLENTKIAMLPPVDGGAGDANSTSGGCGWYCAVNSNVAGTEKEQAALDFMFKVLGYDFSEYIVNNYGFTAPCIVEGIDASAYPQLTQDYLAIMDSVSLTPIYDIHMEASVIEVMNKGLQDLLNGDTTPEDLAAAIQAEQELVKK